MTFTTIPASKGRQQFSTLINEVDETGKIVVFTVHGKSKVAMIDMDLLEEFMENAEFGISTRELIERSNEKTISLDEFKKEFDV